MLDLCEFYCGNVGLSGFHVENIELFFFRTAVPQPEPGCC